MSAAGFSGKINHLWLILLIIWIVIPVSPFFRIQAQQPGIEPGETGSQPKIRSTQVSASVPDIVPPSVPVLISPTDGRLLTTNVPEFVFTGSQDNVGIDHYEFWLDGVVLFGTVAPASQTTSTYILTVANNQFTLLPINRLSDGSHTWKVTAVDGAGLTASSATWSFTVDTQAPTFVITTIDTSTVSISAQDVLTWPTQPIQVTNAEPTLQGTGEANSSGVVRVSLPGQSDQVIQLRIDNNGEWQLQLPSLPVDTIMTLTFTITDPAGNVSIITDLELIRPTIPIVPLPGLSVFPTGSTPQPSQSPWFPPLPLPSPIAHLVGQFATSPRILLAQLMPTAFSTSLQRTTITIFNPLLVIWNGLGLIALLLPLLISLVWLARLIPDALSRHGLQQLFWSIGFWRSEEPQGIVFDTQTIQPIPFATVHTYRLNEWSQPYLTHRLCNRQGEYLPQRHPGGVFRLSADAQGYLFPAVFHPPEHQWSSTYYLGEEWLVDQNQAEPIELVPMVPVDTTSHTRHRRIPPAWLTDVALGKGKAVLPQVILLLIIAVLIPSAVNTLSILVFLLVASYHFSQKLRQKPKPSLFRRTREPIQTAVILLHQPNKITVARSCQQNVISRPINNKEQLNNESSIQAVFLSVNHVELYEGLCSVSSTVLVF